MIKIPTTFILGAGASKPYGFPLWSELSDKIITELSNQDSAIYRAMIDGREAKPETIKTLIARLPNYSTVDELIGAYHTNHPEDPEVRRVANAAVFHFIGELEKPEFLNQTSGHWYQTLWERMNEDADLTTFAQNASRFVTFNYDSSLEGYLYSELYKRVHSQETLRILNRDWHNFDKDHFVHVHGWAKHFEPWNGFYGSGVNQIEKYYFENSHTKTSLNTVKSISEANPDSQPYQRAREWIEACERCVILGFGFAESNIENLQLFDIARGKQVFVSATNMPPARIANLKQRFEQVAPEVVFGSPKEDALEFLNNHCWLD